MKGSLLGGEERAILARRLRALCQGKHRDISTGRRTTLRRAATRDSVSSDAWGGSNSCHSRTTFPKRGKSRRTRSGIRQNDRIPRARRPAEQSRASNQAQNGAGEGGQAGRGAIRRPMAERADWQRRASNSENQPPLPRVRMTKDWICTNAPERIISLGGESRRPWSDVLG